LFTSLSVADVEVAPPHPPTPDWCPSMAAVSLHLMTIAADQKLDWLKL